MKYIRTLKKQLEFTGRLVDFYDISAEAPPQMLTKTNFEENKYPKGMYSAIRIRTGEAELFQKDSSFHLTPDTLLLTLSRSIQTLHSREPATMCIYNFTSEKSPVFFQTDLLYHIPLSRQEEQLNQMMLSPERENNLAANSALHALFRLQYYSWISAYEAKRTAQVPYQDEIQRAAELIERDPGKKISYTELSRTLNLSERNFRKRFTQIIGMSPKAYQQDLRMRAAAAMLKEQDTTMAEISEELGYYSQFQFSRDFKKRFGVNPSEYKKQL